jgi:DNA-binding response OmpR family regulator
LTANLDAWDRDLIKEFIKQSQEQLEKVNHELDLAINFLNVFGDLEIFIEDVNLAELLENLVQDNRKSNIYLVKDRGLADNAFRAQVDPVLTRLALLYLVDEIGRQVEDRQPLEINLAVDDTYVHINLRGSRNLHLPGLDLSSEKMSDQSFSPNYAIAQEIIESQGGEIREIHDPNQPDSGMTLQVLLPLLEDSYPSRGSGEIPRKINGNDARILLAEVQNEYQVSIRDVLLDQGFRVDLAVEGRAALDLVQRTNPHAVIIARELPGLDGLQVTQGIRRWSAVPVLMLSSRENPEELIQAFESGVDDYLKKPFLMDEFLVRLEALLKRSPRSTENFISDIFHSGSIRINYATRQVWKSGSPLDLTPIEYNLLVYLSRHSKQIMTYEQLLNQVWEGPEKGSRQGLFVHVRRLRKKIESDPEHPQIIRNKWGVGYVFDP